MRITRKIINQKQIVVKLLNTIHRKHCAFDPPADIQDVMSVPRIIGGDFSAQDMGLIYPLAFLA
jgi:hypothetical protein